MGFLLSFAEAAAAVPSPVNLAGYALAAMLIANAWRACGAGVGWGLGLWLLGLLFGEREDWTVRTLSAETLGTLSGSLIAMWVALTLADAIRAIRARRKGPPGGVR